MYLGRVVGSQQGEAQAQVALHAPLGIGAEQTRARLARRRQRHPRAPELVIRRVVDCARVDDELPRCGRGEGGGRGGGGGGGGSAATGVRSAHRIVGGTSGGNQRPCALRRRPARAAVRGESVAHLSDKVARDEIDVVHRDLDLAATPPARNHGPNTYHHVRACGQEVRGVGDAATCARARVACARAPVRTRNGRARAWLTSY